MVIKQIKTYNDILNNKAGAIAVGSVADSIVNSASDKVFDRGTLHILSKNNIQTKNKQKNRQVKKFEKIDKNLQISFSKLCNNNEVTEPSNERNSKQNHNYAYDPRSKYGAKNDNFQSTPSSDNLRKYLKQYFKNIPRKSNESENQYFKEHNFNHLTNHLALTQRVKNDYADNGYNGGNHNVLEINSVLQKVSQQFDSKLEKTKKSLVKLVQEKKNNNFIASASNDNFTTYHIKVLTKELDAVKLLNKDITKSLNESKEKESREKEFKEKEFKNSINNQITSLNKEIESLKNKNSDLQAASDRKPTPNKQPSRLNIIKEICETISKNQGRKRDEIALKLIEKKLKNSALKTPNNGRPSNEDETIASHQIEPSNYSQSYQNRSNYVDSNLKLKSQQAEYPNSRKITSTMAPFSKKQETGLNEKNQKIRRQKLNLRLPDVTNILLTAVLFLVLLIGYFIFSRNQINLDGSGFSWLSSGSDNNSSTTSEVYIDPKKSAIKTDIYKRLAKLKKEGTKLDPQLEQDIKLLNPVAIFEIGLLAETLRLNSNNNLSEAFFWFKKSSELGYAQADLKIGVTLKNTKNQILKNQAITYLTKAAKAGVIEAIYQIGNVYASKNSRSFNYSLALNKYLEASQYGHINAAYNLGRLYFLGLGTEKDAKEAYRWFLFAGKFGDSRAQELADKIKQQLDEQTVNFIDLSVAQTVPYAMNIPVNNHSYSRNLNYPK